MSELDAIRSDAQATLDELRRVARVLWSDRDDPQVLSELLVVMSDIRATEKALKQIER
jgi:hypothetical protein